MKPLSNVILSSLRENIETVLDSVIQEQGEATIDKIKINK